MEQRYTFVSCDIVGHSSEPSVDRQRDRIGAINEIVAEALRAVPGREAVWASGGDGGHVAFASAAAASEAVALIRRLRLWSVAAGVPLRLVASVGDVDRIEGADGRVQLVGTGINLAGRLMQFGDHARVVVDERFKAAAEAAGVPEVRFHDVRTIRPKHFSTTTVYLLSVGGAFESAWPTVDYLHERDRLEAACGKHDCFDVIYRAKRLLQINPDDADALAALRRLDAGRLVFPRSSGLIRELFEVRLADEFVRAAQLLERGDGDVLCRLNDEGQTMFLILKGSLAGYLPGVEGSGDQPSFVLDPGEMVGELAFALGRRRTATVVCREPTAMLSFDYTELTKTLGSTPRSTQLRDVITRRVGERIVENVCNSVNWLVGPERNGPLAGLPEPWLDLLPFCRVLRLDWRDRRDQVVVAGAGDLRADCVHLLLSGTVEVGRERRMLDGTTYPILHAPSRLARTSDDGFRLVGDVRILEAEVAGFVALGPERYRAVLAGVARHAGAPAAEGPAHAARPQSTAGSNEAATPALVPVRVFCSYSHDDEGLRDELDRHLGHLKRSGLVRHWHDRAILPGNEWKDEIEGALEAADLILLLVSSSFLASDYCFDKEMLRAMERHEQGEARVVPIILRPADWNSTPFGKLQALPKDAKPVTTWPNRDEAFLDVARGIRRVVAERSSCGP
jgi:hypothetical protein